MQDRCIANEWNYPFARQDTTHPKQADTCASPTEHTAQPQTTRAARAHVPPAARGRAQPARHAATRAGLRRHVVARVVARVLATEPTGARADSSMPPCTCASHGSGPLPATCARHDTRAASGAAVSLRPRTALRTTSATRPVHVNRARACVSAAYNAPLPPHVGATPAARTSAPPVPSSTVPLQRPRPIVHRRWPSFHILLAATGERQTSRQACTITAEGRARRATNVAPGRACRCRERRARLAPPPSQQAEPVRQVVSSTPAVHTPQTTPQPVANGSPPRPSLTRRPPTCQS